MAADVRSVKVPEKARRRPSRQSQTFPSSPTVSTPHPPRVLCPRRLAACSEQEIHEGRRPGGTRLVGPRHVALVHARPGPPALLWAAVFFPPLLTPSPPFSYVFVVLCVGAVGRRQGGGLADEKRPFPYHMRHSALHHVTRQALKGFARFFWLPSLCSPSSLSPSPSHLPRLSSLFSLLLPSPPA